MSSVTESNTGRPVRGVARIVSTPRKTINDAGSKKRKMSPSSDEETLVEEDRRAKARVEETSAMLEESRKRRIRKAEQANATSTEQNAALKQRIAEMEKEKLVARSKTDEWIAWGKKWESYGRSRKEETLRLEVKYTAVQGERDGLVKRCNKLEVTKTELNKRNVILEEVVEEYRGDLESSKLRQANISRSRGEKLASVDARLAETARSRDEFDNLMAFLEGPEEAMSMLY
uniref:SMR49206-like protein n=1 Tax=Zymoseptoria tritici TaxID=1047171 RepID=A0A4D6YV51_ZYMTR|nr:SMR49206-like protein [Zymoseptoria tritici]